MLQFLLYAKINNYESCIFIVWTAVYMHIYMMLQIYMVCEFVMA